MGVVEKEEGNHQPELAVELIGVETEQNIPGPAVVENELSETQRAEKFPRNSNTTTGIARVTK